MVAYQYPGYATGQGWTLEPGNLQGGFWGKYKGIILEGSALVVFTLTSKAMRLRTSNRQLQGAVLLLAIALSCWIAGLTS